MDTKEIPAVDILEAKKLIESRAKALLNAKGHAGPRQLIFWGHSGIGKSELCEQVANTLNIPFVATNLSTLEAPDLQGLPLIKDNTTTYARPGLLPSGEKGIWLLDEINRAPLEIRQALMQLLTTRSVNGHKLGESWLIVAAGNLSDDSQEYQVDELDPALEDRFAHFRLVPKISTVINYLKNKHGTDHLGIRWLTSDNSIVSVNGKGASPRSFDAMCKALTHCPDIDNHLVISGEMGRTAAAAFSGWYKSPASVAFDDIWNCTEHAAEVLSDLQKTKSGSIELLRLCLDGFVNKINNTKNPRELTPKEITKVSWFMNQLTAIEWQTAFMTESYNLFSSIPKIYRTNVDNLHKESPTNKVWTNKIASQIENHKSKKEETK